MSAIPILVALLLASSKLRAQTPAPATNTPDTNVMKLLRMTIAEQTRNPDRIIRTYTNIPPEQTPCFRI